MRHPLGNADAVALEGRNFLGIVGQQAHRTKAELPQHFRRREIDTLVRVETQLLVGIERVKTGVLQPVGSELVNEPDAAPFLRQVSSTPSPACAIAAIAPRS